MLRSPERESHAADLRQLVQRFSAEERSMTAVLQNLQAELELRHREAAFLRLAESGRADALVRRCSELQFECDCLATELVHVRLAVSGAGEELAEHLGRSAQAGPLPWPGRPIALLA